MVPLQSFVLFGYLCLFSNDLNVYYGNYAQDNKKIYTYSVNPFRIQKGRGGGGGGGYFPSLYSKDFQSLMTQGPDLPEAYPGGNRGVRGKGKRLSHN